MALAIVAFVAAFLLTSSLGVLLFYRQKTLQRLSRAVEPPVETDLMDDAGSPPGTEPPPPPGSTIEKLVKPFHKVLPRNEEDAWTVQRRLARAGYRDKSYVNIFYSSKVLVPLGLCILITVTRVSEYAPIFFYALAAGLGFLAPDYWLKNRTSERQMQLRLGLPEALDLIVICLEAGLTMDKATMRTSEEMRVSQPAMASELNLVHLEQRAGCSRADAWKHIADRTDVDTIRSLSAILIQAEKFGTSVAKTLRTHAETLRIQRRQQLEEQAAKTAVKLVFPLVFLIFPSLFVVTIGPSAIIMYDSFSAFIN